MKIEYPASYTPDILEDAAKGGYNVENSPYYMKHDFYNLKPTENITILENFKTFQQTSSFTCGPSCVIMVAEWYGLYDGTYGDRELMKHRTFSDGFVGSTLDCLINMFNSIGDFEFFSTKDIDCFSYQNAHLMNNPRKEVEIRNIVLQALKDGKPVIYGDSSWGTGHWRIIIGYDSLGIDEDEHDGPVLLVADPCDTTTHYQTGYTIKSANELFYFGWTNPFEKQYKKNLFLIASPK